jgi:hypothetical protein
MSSGHETGGSQSTRRAAIKRRILRAIHTCIAPQKAIGVSSVFQGEIELTVICPDPVIFEWIIESNVNVSIVRRQQPFVS